MESVLLSDPAVPIFSGIYNAATVSWDTINIWWSAATDDATSSSSIVYDVYQSTSLPINYSAPTFTTPPGTTFVQVKGLNGSTTYYFSVRARDAEGNRDGNTVVRSAFTYVAPSDSIPPTFSGIVSATSTGQNQIVLTWAAASDNVTSQSGIAYKIFLSLTSTISFANPWATTSLGATSYPANGLSPETTYFFAVRACDGKGNCDTNSAQKSATTFLSSSDTTPPSFSGLVSATAINSNQIDLAWNPATDDVTSTGQIVYEIYRSTTSSITYSAPLATTSPGVTSFSATSLSADTTYLFAVRAKDAAGNRDSNTVVRSATTPSGGSNQPPSFTGIYGAMAVAWDTVNIWWNAAKDDATSSSSIVYDVYQSTSLPINYSAPTFTTPPGTTFVQVKGLNGSTTYHFSVRARDAEGNRDANSVVRSAFTPVAPSDSIPPTFGGLASAIPASPQQIDLAWSTASDNLTSPSGIVYDIYFSTSPTMNYASPKVTTAPGIIRYSVTNLVANTLYYFAVRARDARGNRDSNSVIRSAATLSSVPDTTSPTFTGLSSATAVGPYSIVLAWSPATDDLTSQASIVYDIYMSTTDTVSFTNPSATASPGTTNYTMTGLSKKTSYFFVVRARDTSGNRDQNTVQKSATTPDIGPEEEVVVLINQLRATGATCPGTGTNMPPASPLTMDSYMQSLARDHSVYMAQTGTFVHSNYPYAENIAWGMGSAASVVNAWFRSTGGHCETMLRQRTYNLTGVGRAFGAYDYWTFIVK
ncbi:MAG TPA: fibronectin type III domain-containing protein [Bdellovibrionota bacterium]|nr:fibronectin type III domain-containing protein [Bdellovibrionota bacterium]